VRVAAAVFVYIGVVTSLRHTTDDENIFSDYWLLTLTTIFEGVVTSLTAHHQ
jgi:hypothetical protein